MLDIHFSHLTSLISDHGGPGFEQSIAESVKQIFANYSTDIRTDAMGNVTAVVPGLATTNPRPRIMLAAHMDEIALVVSKIDKGGFLRVVQTGMFDARTLVGQEVTVHGSQPLHGIIGSKPPHLTTPEERKKAAPLDDLYIDLALSEQRVKELVTVGDRITLYRQPMELLNHRISGKALDNRSSIAVLLECLRHLKTLHHTADCYAVATVQEEVRMRGVRPVTYTINPHIGIAVDVTFADMPGQDPDVNPKIDEGPVLTFGPNVHPKVFERLRDTAVKHGIKYQVELSQGATATDANPMQMTRNGIATGLLGIPIRYMHTSVETGSYDDVVETGRLLAHYIASIDHEDVEGLSCY